MSKEFSVEIFALAVGASSSNEVGGVNHELEIISEANLLYLPIQACKGNYYIKLIKFHKSNYYTINTTQVYFLPLYMSNALEQ